MNESTSSSLIESLSAFTEAFQNEEYSKAIELAQPLLILVAADEDESLSAAIYECYMKALIQKEKFEEIVELWNPNNIINNNTKKQQPSGGKKSNKNTQPRPVPSNLEHLRIYALYRLERFEKARELAAAAAATATAAPAGTKQLNGDDDDDESKNDPETNTLAVLHQHLLAQSLFHLQQSAPALQLYQEMLQRQVVAKPTDTRTTTTKEQQQILTNLAAVASANATPFDRCSNLLESQRSTMDALVEKLGQGAADSNDDDDQHDDNDLSDLAYNLATYELLTCPTQVYKWQQVLQKAAAHAVNDDDDDEKQVALIKSNLDWSSRFWNGNVTACAGAAGAVPMNQLSSSAKLIALTNRALSMVVASTTAHDDSKTAANALRLVPATENLTNLTPLQMRLVTYNRALLQYRAHQYSDCRSSCQVLLDSTSGKNSKKKRPTTNAADNASAGVAASGCMIAQPTLDAADAAWWESRIVVLQALCHRAEAAAAVSEKGGEKNGAGTNGQKDKDKNENLLQAALDRISKLPTSAVRDRALVYLQLHQAALLEQKQTTTIHDTIALLRSLPESVQKRRAVVATLASLHQQLGQPDQVQQLLEEMGDDSAYADFLMGQQQYQQAADLYHKAAVVSSDLDGGKSPGYLTAQARYIQALSFVNPQKAQELWLQMRPNVNLDSSNEISGADLEMRELPRLKSSHAAVIKDSAAITAAAALSKTSLTTADGKPKKSRDAVMRQRARKREAYLAQLDKKGLRHVPNPDPERWLPKYERSYNRRRRNRNQQQQQQQHKGAQGGISEKDAAKLDVAARQAARNDAAADNGIAATSTVVSTGGTRKGGRRR
jgi:hypothetical protein